MSTNFQISAVICELNPPHNGHFSLFEQIHQEKSQKCVALLSGNYVQRGQAAIFDKWTRTELALRGGADLVLELPLPWATAGAEAFGFGGVSLLNALGCVDSLWFGSEAGTIEPLLRIAKTLETPAFSACLAQQKKHHPGSSFASLRQRAVLHLLGEADSAVLSHPNNILGISYCQAIMRLSSAIQPHTVQRSGAGYHQVSPQPKDRYPSATQLRAMLKKDPRCDLGPFLPGDCAAFLTQVINDGLGPVFPETLEPAILSKLRTMTVEELSDLPDISEGLEQRLYQAIRRSTSLTELYEYVKTKRYPLARIRRLVLSAFLGVTKQDAMGIPPYCRVLGVRRESAFLLSQLAKTSSIPLILRASDGKKLTDRGSRLLQLEQTATDLYSLAYPRIRPCGREFTQKLVIL